MLGFKRIQVTSKQTITGTAVLFAAGGSGTKWSLTRGIISAFVPAAAAYVEFHETTEGATTDLGIIFCVPVATNVVSAIKFDFGERGWVASATNSRLSWTVDGATASIAVNCVGYYR